MVCRADNAESWGTKNHPIPHLRCLGRFFIVQMLTEFSPGSNPLDSLGYWPKTHINEGLRFLLPPLMHQFLHFTRLYPVHVHLNIVRVLLGVSMLNRKHRLHLGL